MCIAGWKRLETPKLVSKSSNLSLKKFRLKPDQKVIPLIGLKNKIFENMKSTILGFPAGFEYFGPRIQIPREKQCR